MIRMFKGNNFMKGQIKMQCGYYVSNGAITFEKGEKRNTCIIIVDESEIETRELKYMYSKLIPEEREIFEDYYDMSPTSEDLMEWMGLY